MTLGTFWRDFLLTADNTDVLSGDDMLGSLGPGFYGICPISAAANDSTLTVNDGKANVINAVSIPVRAAAVTSPEIKKNEDKPWIIRYEGADHPVINIADGTNGEIAVRVTWYGTKPPRVV